VPTDVIHEALDLIHEIPSVPFLLQMDRAPSQVWDGVRWMGMFWCLSSWMAVESNTLLR